MAPHNRPDGPHGSAAALNPERSDDEVFLDQFADSPGGGTKLYKFLQSYPAIDYFPSFREVERLAQHKVNEIFGAFEDVRYILERHEDTIRKRWCKKSTTKKKKLLLTAKPGMASAHRPDIAAELAATTMTTISDLEDELFFVSVCTARNSEACLVPFLNLEDLLHPGSFLTLLNSRGRNPIETFSHTELHHCPSAWWPDSALLPYLQRFTMVFAVSSECIQRIRFYQPWSMQLEYEMIYRKLELGLEFAIFTGRWRPVSTMRSFEDVALKRMADPSNGKFHYPITERRSCAATYALRLAEENLDDFWKTADSFCRKLTGSSFPDLLERDISHGRSLRRTAPWTEPSARKEVTRFHEVHSESFHQYTYKPFLSESYRGAEALTLVKRKVKTRGTVNLARAEGNDAPDSTDQTTLPISVTVDKRSHLVFKTLFFSPSARDVPGEVSWKDFVHAMVQRGFEAEKLHGSAWRFTPALDTERAIQFHAPHGALSKLPLTWARRYGRRLEREYGWTGEMFTLA